MKHVQGIVNLQKIRVCGLVFMLVLPSFLRSEALNFDSMFPQSPYAQVLTGCKRICGDLDAFEPQQLLADDKALFDDLLVGRLYNVHEALKIMLKKTDMVLADDLVHLAYVIDQIERFYKQRLADAAYEPSPTVISLLHSLKANIESLFTQG